MKLTASDFAFLLYCASVASAAPTVKRQSGTTYDGGLTANDVKNGVCAPLTLIFARGSTEQGNMGSEVGPPLAKALISQLGNDGVAIQGVDYSATIESNISMGADGGPELAKLAQQALQNCPNTKIAISGYSQGATVCHYAVAQGGLDAGSVSSAVLYGDPLLRQSVGDLPSSQVKEFCASGDGVCETGGFAITPAHLSYGSSQDIPEGAQFIVQNAGSASDSSPSASLASPPAPATSSAPADPSAPATSPASPTSPFGSLGSGLPTNPFGSLGSGLPKFPLLGVPSGTAASPFGGLPSGLFSNPFGSLGSSDLAGDECDKTAKTPRDASSGVVDRLVKRIF